MEGGKKKKSGGSHHTYTKKYHHHRWEEEASKRGSGRGIGAVDCRRVERRQLRTAEERETGEEGILSPGVKGETATHQSGINFSPWLWTVSPHSKESSDITERSQL